MSKLSDWLGGMGERAVRLAERRRAAAAAAEAGQGQSAAAGAPQGARNPGDAVEDGKGAADPPGDHGRPAPPPVPASVVPWGMRVAAEVSWRLLVFAAVIWVLMRVVGVISLVVLAFAVGLLLTALMQPTVARLCRWGVARGVATALTVIGGFVAIGLIGWFVTWQVQENIDDMTGRVQQAVEDTQEWLIDGPLHVSKDQVSNVGNNINDWLGENSSEVTSYGLEGVSYILDFFTGAAIAAFVTIFLLYDGRRIWKWTLNFVPAQAREAVEGAGPRVWSTLTGYVRGTVLVAFIDAVFIGGWVWILDVPMAVPIAVIIFLFAFIPIVGALLSGALAVAIAFVTNGWLIAVLVLIGVLVVQQIEGHVLQPFILGRMVRVHPLAVVLTVAAGGLIAGIPGMVVAVPLVAVLNTAVGYLRAYHRERSPAPGPQPQGSTIVDVSPSAPPGDAEPNGDTAASGDEAGAKDAAPPRT